MNHNYSTGILGEQLASDYLHKDGYSILKHHYTCRWGEIDLIAEKDNKIYFFEVKTRTNDLHGKPYEAVTLKKVHSLRRAINYFLLENNYKNNKFSLSVIGIILEKDQSIKEIKIYEYDW